MILPYFDENVHADADAADGDDRWQGVDVDDSGEYFDVCDGDDDVGGDDDDNGSDMEWWWWC